MPKQPRVSLPNLDSLALSPLPAGCEDPVAGGEKRATCRAVAARSPNGTLLPIENGHLGLLGETRSHPGDARLKAVTVEQAKAEADRYSRRSRRHPLPHGLEVMDGLGIVMARRNSEGKT